MTAAISSGLPTSIQIPFSKPTQVVTRSMHSAKTISTFSDPIIWTMLNAIMEQQKEFADLKSQIRKLCTGLRRRHH